MKPTDAEPPVISEQKSNEKRKRRHGQTVALINDGSHWHAGIRTSKGQWWIKTEEVDKQDILPETLLEWAMGKGVTTVRVALPAALYDFVLDEKSPQLINPVDLYELLSWPLSEQSGIEADELAPSVALANELDFGGDPSRVVGAAFERELIEQCSELCSRLGLVFEGIVSLPGLLLAAKQRDKQNRESLLYFGEKESWVAGIAAQETISSFRAITLPAPPEELDTDYQRKMERRIKPYLRHGVSVVCASGTTASAIACITEIEDVPVHASTINDVREQAMEALNAAGKHMLEGPVGLGTLPPKAKDSKYVGTLACLGMIAITLLLLGVLLGTRVYKKHSIEKLRTEIATFEEAQNSAKAEFDSVNNELRRVRATYQSLSQNPDTVAFGFNAILMALSESMPPFSRITAIRHDPDNPGVTQIEGVTLWQSELGILTASLQEQLNANGLSLMPVSSTVDPESEETHFTIKIQ
ncbi:MAG: hypothetical protein AAGF10_03695 [Verrucomicrobiota bacterium]